MKQDKMNKQKQKNEKGWHRLRRPQDDTQKTKVYTEEELQSIARSQRNGSGIMRLDTGELHLPSNLEDSGDGQQNNSPPRVMLVIILFALIFISIITYFVMQMPKKD